MTIEQAERLLDDLAAQEELLCKRADDASGYTRSRNENIRTSTAKTHEQHAKEYRQISEYLKELKQLRKQTRWMPLSDKPPGNGRYLAYIVNKHANELQYAMTCEYFEGSNSKWFPDDECASDNVIAWMPLPEPYKESEG